MKKKFQSHGFEAEYEITGDVCGDSRTLRVTFANLGMEPQTFEVIGGNIELPEFLRLMQEALPLAIGRSIRDEKGKAGPLVGDRPN